MSKKTGRQQRHYKIIVYSPYSCGGKNGGDTIHVGGISFYKMENH